MLDFSHLADKNKADVQVFTGNSSSAGSNWYTWRKPRSINFVQFFALAGGTGGGGGTAPSSATGGGGGSGGSTGAQSLLTFAAWMIPDILYISVGVGGKGGTGASYVASQTSTGGQGLPGVATCVSIAPDSTASNVLLYCSPGDSVSGGTSKIAAVDGAGGSVNQLTYAVTDTPLLTQGLSVLAHYSNSNAIKGYVTVGGSQTIGVNGGNGFSSGAGYAGSQAQPNLSLIGVTPGTGGGGGGGGSGGTLQGVGRFPTIYGGAGGTSGQDGSGGIQAIPGFFYFYGGTGGGGANAGNGGNGGPGSYGCGGGGGGGAMGGASGRKGGDGGQGGDGLVVVVAW